MSWCVYLEETLAEACQWLIAAGFPQYVQLMFGKLKTFKCVINLSNDQRRFSVICTSKIV